jgi:hypothetical protein
MTHICIDVVFYACFEPMEGVHDAPADVKYPYEVCDDDHCETPLMA